MSDEVRHYDLPVPDAFPHVLRTLANNYPFSFYPSTCITPSHSTPPFYDLDLQ
jgi:hypothetical protein